jgi:hypothetical protein
MTKNVTLAIPLEVYRNARICAEQRRRKNSLP